MAAGESAAWSARRSGVSDLVTITGIAVGGDGVGRLSDGRVVFVPRTVPGDRIRLREGSLVRHRNFARAEAGEIVEAGRGGGAPPRPPYVPDHCGGCPPPQLPYDRPLRCQARKLGGKMRPDRQ